MNIGIIGFGHFGEFLCSNLSDQYELKVHDPYAEVPNEFRASLYEVAACDFEVLAVPFAAYEALLPRLRELLREDTVIIDISSIKVEPVKAITQHLPDQPYVALHPLFGPESAADSLDGHTVVLCESNYDKVSELTEWMHGLGLQIVEMSADEHDQEMAILQGLTFFIARGLGDMKLHEMSLSTPSFKRLLSLVELNTHHTDDLLNTILSNNTYSQEAMDRFMNDLEQVRSRFS